MSELRDPRRLSEGTDAALALLREGLGAARAQRPSEAQRAELRAALGLPPAATVDTTPADDTQPPAGHAGGAAGATKGGALLKLVSGTIVVGAGIAMLWQLAPEPAPAPALSPAVEQTAGAGLPAAAPSAATATPAPEEPASAPTAVEPIEGPALESRPTTSAKAASRRAAPRAAKADATAELALLQRARAHVRSAPTRALSLVAEHEQNFPSGVLVQEREVIAIEALQHAGKHAESKRRAAHFRERYPRSAHLRRIDELFRRGVR